MNGADIWGDGEEEGDTQQGLEREWQARRDEHFNSGYREGLEAGKHETVQEGFNQGAALLARLLHAPLCCRDHWLSR